MYPTSGFKTTKSICFYKRYFFSKKNFFIRCSAWKCSWAPTISHIHKRFAFSNVFFTNLFADDISFLKSSPPIETLVIDANFELKKAATYCQANRLTSNVSKTKFMIFRNKNMQFDPAK